MSRRWVLLAAVVALVAAGALGAWLLPGEERTEQPAADPRPTPAPQPTPSPTPTAPPAPASNGNVTVGLLAGSDAREGVAGERADVIMLGVLPDGDVAPALLSLPRDLWVDNPCTGTGTRLNAGLAGCGEEASGPELLAEMAAEVTGVPVDHRLVLDFAGFVEVVDAAGGVEVCTDRAVRQSGLDLELPAGCSTVDGETALAWVRARNTEERVDGQWRPAGDDDLDRTRRQREITVALLQAVLDVDDPSRLSQALRALRAHGDTDAELDLEFALALAARLRDDTGDIVRLEPRVEPHTTAAGAQVLLLAEPVEATVRREHPELAELLWQAGAAE